MMYGREPILPWKVEHDLGPLEDENVPELSFDEVIERMYNLQVQVLDVAPANIKQAQKVQARAYNAKHARNAFEVGEKVWRMNPLWSTKLKALRKGSKWVGPYEIVERKGGGNGNYMLKGKSTRVHTPPNLLKRYVIRNPDIPNGNTSDSEYGSDNEDEAQETSDVTSEIPVHTPVDSDDNTLPDLMVDEPPMLLHVCTPSVSSETLHVHTPGTPANEPPVPPHVCTPSVSSEPLHVRTPSKLFPGRTPSSSIPPAHSDETMSAAKILADLADGGVEPEPEPEEQVVFEDQTLEEVDIDILVAGVQRPAAIKFKPLSLFCRKPVGARLGVHVGKQKGLKRNSGLNFTGLSKVCGHDFEVKSIDGDGNCFCRMISYLLLGVEDKHNIIRASIVEYIVNPENLVRLRSYIPQEFSTGKEYVKATQMHLSTTWETEVEHFTCAQQSGKDVVCYFGKQWLRYPASGNQKKPTRNAFFIANYGQHFTAVVGMK